MHTWSLPKESTLLQLNYLSATLLESCWRKNGTVLLNEVPKASPNSLFHGHNTSRGCCQLTHVQQRFRYTRQCHDFGCGSKGLSPRGGWLWCGPLGCCTPRAFVLWGVGVNLVVGSSHEGGVHITSYSLCTTMSLANCNTTLECGSR